MACLLATPFSLYVNIRYIPLPADGTSTNSTRIRGAGSIGSGIGIASGGGGGSGGSQTGGIAGRLSSDVTEAPVVGSEEVDSAVPGKSASWESRKDSADGTPEEAVAGAGGDADGTGDTAERAPGQVCYVTLRFIFLCCCNGIFFLFCCNDCILLRLPQKLTGPGFESRDCECFFRP